MDRIDDRPRVCWIVVALLPYHEARLRAVADRREVQPCAIALTHEERLRPASVTAEGTVPYSKHVVMAQGVWPDVDRARMVSGLRRSLDELRPAVVCINGWSYGGCFAALEWCRQARVPVVIMSDSTGIEAADNDVPRRRRWWKERIKQRVVRMGGAALVAGAPHARYMARLGMPEERIFQGYDVVDNAHFAAGAEAARAANGRLRAELGLPGRFFLTSGRQVPVKNLDRLLRAFASYRAAAGEEPWSLVVLGDGPERPALQLLAQRLGIADAVRWPGFVAYADLPRWYGLAGAFVLASVSETWGLVVNEAMAAGLPVLVSGRCGCAEDLVEPGRNGLVLDPEDIAQMAAMLHQVAHGAVDRERMGRASEAIVARWSPDRFATGLAHAVRAARDAGPARAQLTDRALLAVMRSR